MRRVEERRVQRVCGLRRARHGGGSGGRLRIVRALSRSSGRSSNSALRGARAWRRLAQAQAVQAVGRTREVGGFGGDVRLGEGVVLELQCGSNFGGSRDGGFDAHEALCGCGRA